MNIKPGDIFFWVYNRNRLPVAPIEKIYTFTLNTMVPCHGLHLCVGVIDKHIHWLTNTGIIYISNCPHGAGYTLRPKVVNHER